MTDTNGWKEYRREILHRIDTLEESLSTYQKATETKYETLLAEITKIQVTLQFKGSLWGAVAGLLSALGLLVVGYLGHLYR